MRGKNSREANAQPMPKTNLPIMIPIAAARRDKPGMSKVVNAAEIRIPSAAAEIIPHDRPRGIKICKQKTVLNTVPRIPIAEIGSKCPAVAGRPGNKT